MTLGYKPEGPVARGSDYEVLEAPHADAAALVRRWHYSGGTANTSVAAHVMVRVADGELVGATLWMPPTRVAAESVDKEEWRDVLSLSRLVVAPGEPKNAAGILLSRSMKMVPARWRHFVTYADTRQGHVGTIYKATNWTYVGEMPGGTAWADTEGRQVSLKAGNNSRTVAEMLALGYVRLPPSKKHKFVFHR